MTTLLFALGVKITKTEIDDTAWILMLTLWAWDYFTVVIVAYLVWLT